MRKFAILATLVFALAACRAGNPIIDVHNAGTGAPKGATLDQVERAIQLGAAHKNWSVRRIKPGLVEAQVQVRSHMATVEIPFDVERFSIIYKDSANLKYRPDGPTIHNSYNSWIYRLKAAILRCTSRIKVVGSGEQLHVKPRWLRWACD